MDDSRAGGLVGRMITLSGLLGGFSFTALVELVTLGDERSIVAATVAFSLLSTVAYIMALFSFVASTSIPMKDEQARSVATSTELFAFYIFWLATIGLLATMALAGWIYSDLVGMVGSTVAVFGLLGMAGLLLVRSRAL